MLPDDEAALKSLLELHPSDFEGFVVELFRSLGFDAQGTPKTRDGGVDCKFIDERPLVGSVTVVVQAKRYRDTVGSPVVRELFGTMSHERAGKGILITTGRFSSDAIEFAKGKSIELIDGIALVSHMRRLNFPVPGVSTLERLGETELASTIEKTHRLYLTGDLEEAGRELLDLMAKDPNNAEAAGLYALCLYDLGDLDADNSTDLWQTAMRYFKNALSLRSDITSPRDLYGLAMTLHRLIKFEDLTYLLHALRAEPKFVHEEYLSGFIGISQNMLCFHELILGQLFSSCEDVEFVDVLKKTYHNGANVQAHRHAAWDALSNDDTNAASDELKQCLSLNPDEPDSNTLLGFQLFSTNEIDNAIGQWERCLILRRYHSSRKRALDNLGMALAYSSKGKMESAKSHFLAALDGNPSFISKTHLRENLCLPFKVIQWHSSLVECLDPETKNKFQSEAETFNQMPADEIESLCLRAFLLLSDDEIENAIESWETCLKSRDDSDTGRAVDLIGIAFCNFQLNNIETARQFFIEACAADNDILDFDYLRTKMGLAAIIDEFPERIEKIHHTLRSKVSG